MSSAIAWRQQSSLDGRVGSMFLPRTRHHDRKLPKVRYLGNERKTRQLTRVVKPFAHARYCPRNTLPKYSRFFVLDVNTGSGYFVDRSCKCRPPLASVVVNLGSPLLRLSFD